jgi:predicted transcriptional regulator
MAKVRTTVTLDEDVMRAVRLRAARDGRRDSDVIEEALRRALDLDLLDRLWDKAELEEGEATELAVKAQHTTRRRSRKP